MEIDITNCYVRDTFRFILYWILVEEMSSNDIRSFELISYILTILQPVSICNKANGDRG